MAKQRLVFRSSFLRSYLSVLLTSLAAPWSEADSIRPYHLVGLHYLRVGSSTSGHEVWVPLFLTDMQEFRKAVRDFAGEEHCLTLALQGTKG